ncbi:MAG: hypothetical protein WC734_04330 [Patescibacteria group bacterium]|jgi:hypothetical protein
MPHTEIDQLEKIVEKRATRRHRKKHPVMKVNSRSVFGLVKTIKRRAENKASK